jgi:hypothetical protein
LAGVELEQELCEYFDGTEEMAGYEGKTEIFEMVFAAMGLDQRTPDIPKLRTDLNFAEEETAGYGVC